MAVEIAAGTQVTKTFIAGEDLSAKQYYLVKLSSGNVVACSGVTDVPIGVVQNKPALGKAAEVVMLGGTKIVSSAATTAGALIGTAATGKAAAKTVGTDITHYVVGTMVTATGGADQVGTAVINCLNPHRAS
jgi:hypothetical protein